MLALLVSGCATTQIDASWFNQSFANRKISGRVLVVGVTRDETVRRLYEDTMQAQLAARGVEAVRSYEVLGATLAPADASTLLQAAQGVAATRVVASALVAHENVQRARVDPMPAWRWDYFGWYDYYWPFGYTRAELYEYDRYVVSTTLTESASGEIIWSVRTTTATPGRVETEIHGFTRVIVRALERDGLL